MGIEAGSGTNLDVVRFGAEYDHFRPSYQVSAFLGCCALPTGYFAIFQQIRLHQHVYIIGNQINLELIPTET